MNLRWKILKSIFYWSVKREAKNFENQLENPLEAQQKVLKILGLEKSIEDFPISDENSIPKIPAHEVLAYELTSGSSGVPKKIPYTKNLMKSFHAMFRLWAWDVIRSVDLKSGTFFFSISPQDKLGSFQEDKDYLQNTLQFIMKPLWTVDAKKMRHAKPNDFMKNLAYELIKRDDLEIISIWSPSYLLSLLREIKNNSQEWAKDSSIPYMARRELKKDNINWSSIWPNLKFISAWGSALAESGFKQIQNTFPAVTVQMKGLLATEAPMTIPWSSANGFVPLLNEVYFEFLDENGNIFKLQDLKLNSVYEIVITTTGKLIRYKIGDQVRVSGFYKKTPMLDFVGRSKDVCDLVGEKLSETFLRTCLREEGFHIAVPHTEESRYMIFFEQSVIPEKIENKLLNLYHYEIARRNKQLQPAQVIIRPTIRQEYFQWLESRNMRLGDIKEKSLIANLSMARDFLKHLKIEHPQLRPFFPENKFETDSFVDKH